MDLRGVGGRRTKKRGGVGMEVRQMDDGCRLPEDV